MPIYSATYRAGPKAREFVKKKDMDEILSEEVIELAQTELEIAIVFGPKKDSLLRFCVVYKKRNVARKRDV